MKSGGSTTAARFSGSAFLCTKDGCIGRVIKGFPRFRIKEIIERGHTAFFADYGEIERGLQEKRYAYESTSGTTLGPMTVIMEDGWWDAQTKRAYRAHPLLAPYADHAYRKCILAPVGCSSNLCPYEDHPFPHQYSFGTVYLNLTSDPFAFPEPEWDRIVLELQAVKPEVIEGEPILPFPAGASGTAPQSHRTQRQSRDSHLRQGQSSA